MREAAWRSLVRRLGAWLLELAGPAPVDRRVFLDNLGRITGHGLRRPSFWYQDWKLILRKDPCTYCGGAGGTVEHITPQSAGGQDTIANMVGACGMCNVRKRSHPLWLYLLMRSKYEAWERQRLAMKVSRPTEWIEAQLLSKITRKRTRPPLRIRPLHARPRA